MIAVHDFRLHTPSSSSLQDVGSRVAPCEVRGAGGDIYTGWSTGRPHTCVRRWAIFLKESSAFETLALGTILANCITMAADYPIDVEGTLRDAATHPDPLEALHYDLWILGGHRGCP